MDTRSKILSAAQVLALSARPLVVVTGYFDVLRAAHAREIEEIRDSTGAGALLVIILPHPFELLPPRARAELVAALRHVDHVAIGPVPLPSGACVKHLEHSDERRLRELRESIVSRTRVQ